MNKILIVGHPASGLEAVERQLMASGMSQPLPSRREGMLPQHITQVILKAHGCELLEGITEESAFAPLAVAPVWQGMAMDLMLGNIDQPFWGWADPASIHLLEYWRTLDPAVVFVLVYDHPASALLALGAQAAQDQAPPNHALHALDNWVAYNGALLSFHLRHGARSLLISREQARLKLGAYLAELQGRFQRPLHISEQTVPLSVGSDLVISPTWLSQAIPNGKADTWHATEVERYLVEQWLADQPNVLQLYAQLQSAGTLAPVRSEVPASAPRLAWEALIQHRDLVNRTVRDILSLRAQAHAELATLRAQSARLSADSSAKVTSTQSQLAATQSQLEEAKKEGELLLQQLHQVQEELEKYVLDLNVARERVKAEAQGKADALNQIEELKKKLQAETQAHHQEEAAKAEALRQRDELAKAKEELTQTQSELRQRLQVEMQASKQKADASSKVQDLELENDLLLRQLHLVQEALERHYLENQQLKDKLPKAAPKRYGAADRVRQQLTYRLGARVLKQLKSVWGILFLYQALAWEAYAFHRDQKALAGDRLPSIRDYADAHEAETVKRHLAYRLGVEVKRMGWNPFKWPMLPFALSRAHADWKRERGKS